MEATRCIGVSMVLALAVSQLAAGQEHAGRMYDPSTVETVSGEVIRVVKVPHGGRGRGGLGVHLELKTDRGTLPVELGPDWYVSRQSLKLAPGDRVEVTGSQVTLGGKPSIVAARVKKGDHTLTLRDEHGAPMWGGGGRRRHGAP